MFILRQDGLFLIYVFDCWIMSTCTICKQSFYKPYNLRRHISQFHPEKPTLKLERMSRNNFYNQQHGAGKPLESDEEDEMDDEKIGSDGESDSENDTSDVDGDGDDDEDDEQDENWVFDRMLDADENNDDDTMTPSIKERQKMFKKRYADFLIWLHYLKRNPTHKKIMETVKDLQDGPLEYDREEAIQNAIEQRKFLLDRIVQDRKCRADDRDGDDDNDEDDDDDGVQMMT